MIPYLAVPLFSFLLVIAHNCVLERISGYQIPLELPLLLVLYAGWYWGNIRGMLISLLLGLLMDWLYAPFYGLYGLAYLAIFFVGLFSEVVLSGRTLGKYYLVLIAVLLKIAIFALLYQDLFVAGAMTHLLAAYSLQALFLCMAVTPFFRLLAGVEKRFAGAPQ